MKRLLRKDGKVDGRVRSGRPNRSGRLSVSKYSIVRIHGATYYGLEPAAEALGISINAVGNRIRNQREGYELVSNPEDSSSREK